MYQELSGMNRWDGFPPPRGWLALAAVSGLLLVAVTAGGEQTIFRTGTELSETLTRRVGFEISGDSRRDALQMIEGQFRIALFLDRRLDPDVPLTYRTQNTPLGIALEEMTSQFNAAVTWIGPLGYIGPANDVQQWQQAWKYRAKAPTQSNCFTLQVGRVLGFSFADVNKLTNMMILRTVLYFF